MPSFHPGIAKRLDADQRVATTHTGTPTLCLAPGGSGKSSTIGARIAYHIRSGIAAADRILTLTFTNRAAATLKERVAEFLAPGGRARAR